MSHHDDHENRGPRRRRVCWGERRAKEVHESSPPACRGDNDGDEEDHRNRPSGPFQRPGDRPNRGDIPVDREPHRPAGSEDENDNRGDEQPIRRSGGMTAWVLSAVGAVLLLGGIGGLVLFVNAIR